MKEVQARRMDHPYPEFSFQLNNGKTLSSAGLKGKIVVIDCWFEGCHPCMAEVDALNELHDSLSKRDDVMFFSIAREKPEDVARIIAARGIRYGVVPLVDSASHYNLSGGYPAKIIVDRNGIVVYYRGGGSTDKIKARKHVMEEFFPEILAIANLDRSSPQ